jgi:ATP-dependent DNA ligase
VKHRLNAGQEFVIGGFMPGLRGVDALIVGLHRDGKLVYAASIRAGLIPNLRRRLFDKLSPLKIGECPFVNLPEKGKNRWGEGLTADKMVKCTWVRPEVVAQIEFLEWTDADHLRHPKFIRFREDKDARSVVKEQ